jgi:hypothetical protein
MYLQMKELSIGESMFRIYPNGDIERKLKSGRWKIIPNVANQNQGYNVIFIEKKTIHEKPASSFSVSHSHDGKNINVPQGW